MKKLVMCRYGALESTPTHKSLPTTSEPDLEFSTSKTPLIPNAPLKQEVDDSQNYENNRSDSPELLIIDIKPKIEELCNYEDRPLRKRCKTSITSEYYGGRYRKESYQNFHETNNVVSNNYSNFNGGYQNHISSFGNSSASTSYMMSLPAQMCLPPPPPPPAVPPPPPPPYQSTTSYYQAASNQSSIQCQPAISNQKVLPVLPSPVTNQLPLTHSLSVMPYQTQLSTQLLQTQKSYPQSSNFHSYSYQNNWQRSTNEPIQCLQQNYPSQPQYTQLPTNLLPINPLPINTLPDLSQPPPGYSVISPITQRPLQPIYSQTQSINPSSQNPVNIHFNINNSPKYTEQNIPNLALLNNENIQKTPCKCTNHKAISESNTNSLIEKKVSLFIKIKNMNKLLDFMFTRAGGAAICLLKPEEAARVKNELQKMEQTIWKLKSVKAAMDLLLSDTK